jgi:hypothetical protein
MLLQRFSITPHHLCRQVDLLSNTRPARAGLIFLTGLLLSCHTQAGMTKRLIGFVAGAGVGAALILNSRGVKRGLAKAVVKGSKAATTASRRVMRASSEMLEDFQDALAEARLEEETRESIDPAEILASLRDFRQELDSVQSTSNPIVQ